MSENDTKIPEERKANLRAFIQPIFFVILIAIVLSLSTLEFYALNQENIIENNDFESDSAKWTISGTTFGLPAYSGSKSAIITPGGYVAQDLSDIPVEEKSLISFWVLDADNATLEFIVYYNDNTTTVINFTLGNTGLWKNKNITNLVVGKFVNKINITNTDASANINVDYFELSIADIPDISPIPENPEDPGGIALGAILNMLFYVTLAFIGGLIVLVIIKKGLMQFLVYFFAAMMGFSWFVFGLFYGVIVLFEVLNLAWAIIPSLIQEWINDFFEWSVTIGTQQVFMIEILLYIFALLLGLLGTISFGIQSFDKIWLRNLMMIFFGAMIGSMLAIHLGLLTTLLILVGLSLYDIYAVFRGPLKGIIEHGRESVNQFEENMNSQNEVEYEKVPLLPALPVYSTPLINIGLGDFAFFSMLISTAVVIGSKLATPIPLIMSLIGLFIGAYYTFRLLKKDRALPGLPLPIFGGLGCLVLGILSCLLLGISTMDSVINLFA
ncbi:MAG: hypothetical protein ACFFB5_21490 [Promethearchaeota archaeon]